MSRWNLDPRNVGVTEPDVIVSENGAGEWFTTSTAAPGPYPTEAAALQAARIAAGFGHVAEQPCSTPCWVDIHQRRTERECCRCAWPPERHGKETPVRDQDVDAMIAACEAAYAKMTPGPWSRSRYPSLLDPTMSTVADFEGVCTIVNAYPTLRDEITRLRGRGQCSTCSGQPHVSGLVCICGGTNDAVTEAQNLRVEAFDQRRRADDAEAKITQLREALRHSSRGNERHGKGER